MAPRSTTKDREKTKARTLQGRSGIPYTAALRLIRHACPAFDEGPMPERSPLDVINLLSDRFDNAFTWWVGDPLRPNGRKPTVRIAPDLWDSLPERGATVRAIDFDEPDEWPEAGDRSHTYGLAVYAAICEGDLEFEVTVPEHLAGRAVDAGARLLRPTAGGHVVSKEIVVKGLITAIVDPVGAVEHFGLVAIAKQTFDLTGPQLRLTA